MDEEQYIAAVIRDFERGFLDIPQDTHLRKFVSRVLSCEDMRISKAKRYLLLKLLNLLSNYITILP